MSTCRIRDVCRERPRRGGRHAASYGAKDIQVLEGLEPVRKRPGHVHRLDRPDGLHHLVYEVVDNSVDEAMAGHATRIDVTLLADGGCRVIDDGRGIPVDVRPALQGQVGRRGRAHRAARRRQVRRRGLQGLRRPPRRGRLGRQRPVAAPRARDRPRRQPPPHEFANGGKPQGKLEVVGKAPRGRTGTTVTFWPDATIFD